MRSSTEEPNLAHPDRKTIQSLFNAISSKYDFLNSFLSFGLHHYWRRKLVEHSSPLVRQETDESVLWRMGEDEGGGLSPHPSLPPRRGEGMLKRRILDLGVGTGKSLASFLRHHRFEQAVGCDFSLSMLEKAQKRFARSVVLVACDFHELPFPSGCFDLVTGSFILRSVQEVPHFLSEVERVLVGGGRAVFLELTRPSHAFLWRFIYQPYLKYYVPWMGKLFSRHEHAYEFLSQSIQYFVEPEVLREQFVQAGFADVSVKPLSFGTATILKGKRKNT